MAAAEKRVPGIDLLRGLCILAVILNHINLRIRLNQSGFGRWIGPNAIDALVWNGHEGVRIFFVISGFLITTWTLRRWGELQRIEVRRFYAMRFARIVPCLIGLLALLTLLDRLDAPRFTINTQHTTLAHALFSALTFHINWLEARTGYLPAGWDILWSLSVEEAFYLFFPALCGRLKKPMLIVPVFLAFIVTGPFARSVMYRGLWVDYGYSCCMDGIAIGCLAALVCGQLKLGARMIAFLYGLGAFLALLLTIIPVPHLVARLRSVGVDETILELGLALLLIAMQQRFDVATGRQAAKAHRQSRLTWRLGMNAPGAIVRWFGRDSYEVYLTHQSINLAPLWYVATIVVAGLLGQLVAQYYSEPLNRYLRKRLMGAPQLVTAAANTSRQLA